ncbi:hypothetical protein KFE98_02885 [bacterium SCSIO 12741]|nr:hypothetical protein KFE98_02885 [bacterium SCSIO 12741]
MKQRILTLIIMAFGLSSMAQLPWSKIKTTGQYSTYLEASNFKSGIDVPPDAIVVNQTNSNSIYDEGTVFMAYSSHDEFKDWTNTSEIGAWILGFEPSGNLILSRKIEIPSAFIYGDCPEGYLKINSLRYDNDDLLVFTGKYVCHLNNANQSMIIGTYNLQTGAADIYIKNFTQNHDKFDQIFPQNSKGIGVQQCDEDGIHYLAIGEYEFSHLPGDRKPFAVAFEVDPNGAISIKRVKTFPIDFLPRAVNKAFTGHSVYVAGLYNPHATVSVGCPNYSQGQLGTGIFEFKYEPLSNSLFIAQGQVIYSKEFEEGRSWFTDESSVALLYNPYRFGHGILTFNKLNASGLPYETGVLHINSFMTTPNGYSVSARNGVSMESFQVMDHNGYFKLTFRLDDPSNFFNQPNSTSIGRLKMDPYNMGNPSLTINSIHTDDATNPIRDIQNVTGAYYNNGRVEYAIADGLGQNTDDSRAHIYGYYRDEFPTCHNTVEARVSALCLKDYLFAEYPGNDKFTFDPMPFNLITVTGDYSDCNNYSQSNSFKKSLDVAEINQASPISIKQIDERNYRVDSEASPQSIKLLDMTGKEVQIHVAGRMITVPEVEAGIYLIRVSFKNQETNHTQKIWIH